MEAAKQLLLYTIQMFKLAVKVYFKNHFELIHDIFISQWSKDRDTTFYLRGPWVYRVRSEASQNLEC